MIDASSNPALQRTEGLRCSPRPRQPRHDARVHARGAGVQGERFAACRVLVVAASSGYNSSPMDLEVINARVDRALADNRRAEWLVLGMATALFAVGLLVLLVAYWLRNAYVATGSVLVQGFMVFPITQVLKLRRDNLILQTFPGLIAAMPADKAAVQIVKTLDHLRGASR